MPLDWPHLRRRSLQPGGFGKDRVHIWPRLLGVDPSRLNATTPSSSSKQEPHRDEYQIKLDTTRSFVLYPHNPSDQQRGQLQTDLHELIVALFRKRPKLNYFQGYHDIVSVLFLTLPKQLQLPCVEKLSLHRLRDSMGVGLEPVLGLLRVTKKLIKLADPEMSAMLDQSSQLPFFALSNLLTLFSHDMPSLPLIQHVFDYLLCRPPIAVVYLVTAITLSRKEEVRRLQEEDEDGMIHSLLSSLPNLADDPEPPPLSEYAKQAESSDTKPSPAITLLPNGTVHSAGDTKEESGSPASPDDTATTIVVDPPSPGPTIHSDEDQEHETNTEAETEGTPFSPPPESDLTLVDPVEPIGTPIFNKPDNCEALATSPKRVTTPVEVSAELNPKPSSSPSTPDPTTIPLPASRSPTPTPSPSPSRLNHELPPSSSPSLSRSPSPSPSNAPLTLTSLLTHADTLYNLYPPTHPQLSLSLIMGPQSTIHTWSEKFRDWPSDTEAEVMVTRPDLIVYPYDPQASASEIDTDYESGESESVDEDYENARLHETKGVEKTKKRRRKLMKSSKQYQKHKDKEAKQHKNHKYKYKKRFGFVRNVEKRAMLAGAVVVLGIAMAMYGVKNGDKPSGGGFAKDGSGGRHWPWSW